MKELKTMKVNEIKNIARAMGIKGWWDMKKAQLIETIENHQQTEPPIEDEPIVEEHVEEHIEEHVEEVASEAPKTTEVVTNETNRENEENVSETT